MPYIGNSPANVGNYQVVDDISSTFNGVLTSFALTASSLAINPAKSGQLLVSINGVLQEPDDTGTEGFKVSGSNIVFSSAPATGSTFWAVWQGQNVDIGTPSDGVVGTAQMSSAELALTGGLSLGDNVKAKFGASDDLQIYHDGSNSYINESGIGALNVRGTDLYLRNAGNEVFIGCLSDGAVYLRYDNVTKLATTSTGVNVTGSVTADGLTSDGATNYPIKWTGAGGAATGSLYGDGSSVGLFYGDSSFATGLNFTTDTLKFRTGSSERLRIDSDGLKFNGDTAAASALDDYEEGTWTPTFSGMTFTSGTVTGKYVKIGDMVTVTVYMTNATATGTPTHAMGGLPYACGGHRGSLNFATHHRAFSTAIPAGIVQSNTAQIEFLSNVANTSWVVAQLRATSSMYIHASATYYVSS